MKYLTLILALSVCLFGQATEDGDALVTVPKRYVAAEGLSHQEKGEAAKWVGMGREIGIATKEGLNAVVDVSERFGSTNVGQFVMFMVAWKIIGRELVGIVIGIPFSLLTLGIWIWSMKRFFFGQRVVVKEDAILKTKEWGSTVYKFDPTKDGRVACGAAHGAAIVAWLAISGMVIFR